MTFNAQFKRIFGETFQSEGFQYCSKLNAFVKMLNEELLAFIGVRSAPAWKKGSKGFMITSGIMSVYYDSIDKKTIQCKSQTLNEFVPSDEIRVSFEYDDSDQNLYNAALEEAERRKNDNLQKLSFYKIV